MYRKHFLNKALLVLLASNGLVIFASAMLGPIYALFVREVGGSLFDASLTGGMFSLAAGITTLVSGRYADKLKESEYLLVLGNFVLGISFLLYIFVNSMFELLLVQALAGFADAIYYPAYDALFSRHLFRRGEGRAWGTWEAMFNILTAAGAIVGGALVTLFGFNSVFLLMATLSFISGVYIWIQPRKLL